MDMALILKNFYGRMKQLICMLIAIAMLLVCACEGDEPEEENIPDTYDPGYDDDYTSIAGIENSGLWGPYNLHDPSILKFENEYHIFSTDVMYGGTARAGIMRRKSSDLVQWFFKGWVFDEIPDDALAHITGQGETAENIWAPYALMIGDQVRLYYSVSVFGKNISAIGLATSDSPYGPWEDQGIVISTTQSSTVNAIDPAVIVNESNGKHWMAYGSYWSGIYIVELDPATGKRLDPGDMGHKIAAREYSGASIEGPEILYHPGLHKYYLFVSYGWLEDSYNVRVGRSDNPEGPYYDYFGNDMAASVENYPIITAQYRFNNHPGWQGFGHCGVMRDGDNYYYVSQARLSSNIYLMDLHVRRMLWTEDGWPVITPERYVNVPQSGKTSGDLAGSWEYIYFEKTESRNFSTFIELMEDGSISGMDNTSWSFTGDILRLSIADGATLADAYVSDEWDWENDTLTICFSGLSDEGRTVWGKKIKAKPNE
jgi:arabinan endo-1,5-alpha-L-arabinosidase